MKIVFLPKRGAQAIVLFGVVLSVAGCLKTPSEKYGLAPPDNKQPYPVMTLEQPRKRAVMTPEEQARAVADLERNANRQSGISASKLRVRGVNGR
jgi:hypothetical protein